MSSATGTVTRNLLVGAALSVGLCLLVVVQTLVLAFPTGPSWWLAIAASALLGFVWANAEAYASLQPPARMLAIGVTVLVVWGFALLVAATLSVNLKFALGGRV